MKMNKITMLFAKNSATLLLVLTCGLLINHFISNPEQGQKIDKQSSVPLTDTSSTGRIAIISPPPVSIEPRKLSEVNDTEAAEPPVIIEKSQPTLQQVKIKSKPKVKSKSKVKSIKNPKPTRNLSKGKVRPLAVPILPSLPLAPVTTHSTPEFSKESEQKVASLPPTQESSEDVPKETELPDPFVMTGEDIILDVYLRGELLYQGLFCQGRGTNVFLPLSEMFGVVGFPIVVNEDGATGWYIKKKRTFNFSLDSGEVSNRGTTRVIPESAYFTYDDDIFMTQKEFVSLFPLQLNIDLHALTMDIIPNEHLPMELMKIRQANRRIYKAKNGLRYPLQDLEYAAVAPPRLDAKVNVGYTNRNDKETSTASVSGLFRGDLLYMSTALYGTLGYDISGKNSEMQYDNFSLTAERLLKDNPFLTKFTLGDIIPASTPMGSGGRLERGVRITNKSISSSSTYDSKTFTGKALPGWDVELYRNNQLVGFQTIGPNGTYIFEDVSLQYGANRFKLVLYGTEGQEEVREEVVTVGTNIRPGEIEYDASYTQQGIGVFDKEYSQVSTVDTDLQGTSRVKSGVNIGIGKGMALRTGFTYDTFRNEDRFAGSAGLSCGYEGILGQFDIGHSSYGSTQVQGSLRGSLPKGQTYSLEGTAQDSDNYEESSTKNSAAFSINDSADLTETMRASFGGRIGRTHSTNQDGRDSIYYDIGTNLALFSDIGHFSTNLTGRVYEEKAGAEEPSIFGTSTFYTSHGKGTLRGSVDYGINDEDGTHFRSISASGTLRMTSRASTAINMSKYMIGERRFSVSNTWSYKTDTITPYIQGTWSDDDSYSAFAGFSLSIDFDPDTFLPGLSKGGAGYGGAACLVYNDKNYNNVFDNEDMPVEDVELLAQQSNQVALTDENGRALFTSLPPLHGTDISVDPASVKDIQLSAEGGTAVMPRKGKIYNLEFPLHVTGEAEGYVYLLRDDEARGKGQVPIELVDDKGKVVKKTWTEQDGFFVLDNILPGTYSLKIQKDFLENRMYVGSASSDIEITSDGNVVADNYLFYGKDKTVAALKDKFNTSLKLGDDVQMFTNFTDLDSPIQVASNSQSLKKSGVIRLENIEEDYNKLDKQITEKSVPTKAENTTLSTTPSTSSNYALVVDTFVSKKNAERAVRHYMKKYADRLKGLSLSYQKDGDAYVVIVTGLQNKEQLSEITSLFICKPRIIQLSQK